MKYLKMYTYKKYEYTLFLNAYMKGKINDSSE